jgi:hypothetical protein
MSRCAAIAVLLGSLCVSPHVARTADALPKGVACLLEENASDLLPQLTNPGGDLGEGEVETEVVFSGKSAIKITNYQRYFNLLPGWAYPIAENPEVGQYRYLRFAWKAEGLTGIMLQLHDERDWHIRYTAGANKFGWETKTVAETPPAEWTVVTIDLFKDFGKREIHGIALTAFDGTAGYFDHIYLARSLAELDAVDATDFRKDGPIELLPEQVDQHWGQLSSPDASVAYRAFWTLAAAGESARVPLSLKAGHEVKEVDAARITAWLKQLDDDAFALREEATTQLIAHFSAAPQLIEEELTKTTSAEVRGRLERILATARKPLSDADRARQQARRLLKIIAERQGRN